MGCEDCRLIEPKHFAKCKIGNNIPFKGNYLAPCGMDFDRGSNITPKKKKRKKKK